MNGLLLFHIGALIFQAIMFGLFIIDDNIFGVVWCTIWIIFESYMTLYYFKLTKSNLTQ